LIKSGVGRDNISDFTTNLIKDYLLTYTEVRPQVHRPEVLRRALGNRRKVQPPDENVGSQTNWPRLIPFGHTMAKWPFE
jgi:hypothetical protein